MKQAVLAHSVIRIGGIARMPVAGGIRRMRMTMTVVGLGRRNGVLNAMQLAHRAQGRLDRHAEHQQHQQCAAQESAMAAEAVHALVAY